MKSPAVIGQDYDALLMEESMSNKELGKAGLSEKEVLEHLKKEGVTNLEQLASLIVKKSNPTGDPHKPVTNSVIIYHHGFVTS